MSWESVYKRFIADTEPLASWRPRDGSVLPPSRLEPMETSRSPNLFLASVPSRIYDSLQPHLKLVQLQQGTVLFRRGDIIDRVYFPCSGIISLVVELTSGPTIETAMIGRDSVYGGASALNAGISTRPSFNSPATA